MSGEGGGGTSTPLFVLSSSLKGLDHQARHLWTSRIHAGCPLFCFCFLVHGPVMRRGASRTEASASSPRGRGRETEGDKERTGRERILSPAPLPDPRILPISQWYPSLRPNSSPLPQPPLYPRTDASYNLTTPYTFPPTPRNPSLPSILNRGESYASPPSHCLGEPIAPKDSPDSPAPPPSSPHDLERVHTLGKLGMAQSLL